MTLGEVVDVGDSIRLPDNLSPGEYKLSIADVGEEETEPLVQPGIEGRDEEGWDPLSTLKIGR